MQRTTKARTPVIHSAPPWRGSTRAASAWNSVCRKQAKMAHENPHIGTCRAGQGRAGQGRHAYPEAAAVAPAVWRGTPAGAPLLGPGPVHPARPEAAQAGRRVLAGGPHVRQRLRKGCCAGGARGDGMGSCQQGEPQLEVLAGVCPQAVALHRVLDGQQRGQLHVIEVHAPGRRGCYHVGGGLHRRRRRVRGHYHSRRQRVVPTRSWHLPRPLPVSRRGGVSKGSALQQAPARPPQRTCPACC